jgi:hypothetical protein
MSGIQRFLSGKQISRSQVDTYFEAVGGNSTVLAGGYKIHIYTSTSSDTFSVGYGQKDCEILVVAGGGGGGWDVGAGGGAGGLCYSANYTLNFGAYSTVVGAGGVGASGSSPGPYNAVSGSNSNFGSILAYGGGKGAGWSSRVGENGGSGGGGPSNTAWQYTSTQNSGTGYTGFGNSGGAGGNNTANSNGYAGCGGGGGAGGAGGPGNSGAFGANSVTYAYGGAGRQYATTGTNTWYAFGGPGCSDSNINYGAAATGGPSIEQSSGANTGGGGGGGGGSNTGGNGGSGIIVVRYLL